MTHDDARPEFVQPAHAPKGRSPQRVIQRPRIPDPTWTRALTRAHEQGRPIGHVLTELLDQWLEETGPGPDRTGPSMSTDRTDRTEVER